MIDDIFIIFDGDEKPLRSLLTHFEYYLKREEGISGFEKAKRKRKKIIESVQKFIKNMDKKELDINELYNASKIRKEQDRKIQYFYNFLKLNGYGPSEIEEVEEEEKDTKISKEATEEQKIEPPIIGRVALTIKTPAKPSEFTFWVTENKEIRNKIMSFPIEPGRLVSVTSDEKNITVLGIISDVETHADIESPTESFYGYGVGDPEIEMPTNPVVITSAKVEVVYRSDRKAEPLMGQWKVRPATDDEIRKAYGSEISKDEDELLIGFGYDWRGKPVPIPAHIRHILGYEAAHINISGAAGAATKTSYALFLIFSILAHSKRKKNYNVAAIAFNVKEADLLRIDQLPKWEEIDKWSRSGPYKEHASLWKFIRNLQEPYSIDPIDLKKNFKFFVPERGDGTKITLRDSGSPSYGFRYGAIDLAETRSLHLLLDPQDLDDKSAAVVWSLMDEILDKNLSFKDALEKLKEAATKTQRWEGVIGGVPHHKDTINKVRNRAENAIRYQLTDLLALKDRIGNPIPIWDLQAGSLWVIDISRLHDKGQRLLFHWIMRALHEFLEKKRSGQIKTEFLKKEVDLKKFPDRVVVFVDELNKFAPSGSAYSAIKRDIVDITARGRSIGLSLIGAQQLASKVDEEVLANTSTFAVGRSHPVEIGKATYGWLPKGLKERATTLERGWMIVWHGAHRRPVFIRFPMPLHVIKAEQKTLEK